MTTQEAIEVLRNGGELVDLAEAVGHVVNDPIAPTEALMLGLKYDGLVAEQAALALYRRSGRPLPDDRSRIETSPTEWAAWLGAEPEAKVAERPRHRPEGPKRTKIG